MPETETSRFVWIIPIGALVVALADMPYGYYQLLRVLIFCTAAYLAFDAYKRSETNCAWVLGGISLVYNPVAKLALGRDMWSLVNLATILVFAGNLLWRLKTSRRAEADQ